MVDHLQVAAYYKGEIVLSDEALRKLTRFKRIALFASVQFIKLEKVLNQLKDENVGVLTTHGKRTPGKYQLLGCDCSKGSFKDGIFSMVDAILYIGDGMFHPKALLLAQGGRKEQKEVFVFDPIAKSIKAVTRKEIEKELKKYKANLVKYMQAENIGVLISIKPGQQYLKNALELKKKSKKNVFLFLDDTFNMQNMENFPFVDVWVNSACPRIGFDDLINTPRPIININDAFNPERALENVF